MASNEIESLKDTIVYLTQQLKTKDEKIAELERKVKASSVNIIPMVFDRSRSNVTDSVTSQSRPQYPEVARTLSTRPGQLLKWVTEKLGEVKDEEDEQRRRMCMVKAIKENCKDIVTTIPYTNSLLPDVLRQNGCLGEEEDVRLRQQHMGKMNEIRRLITLLLDKDYRSMLVFVGFILEFDPSLGRRINESSACFLDGCSETTKKCTVCTLVSRVDIALVMDDLFSMGLIDKDMYSEFSTHEEGHSGNLWQSLITHTLRNGNHDLVAGVLVEVLYKVEYHSDIVQMLRKDIGNHANSFDCKCGLEKRMHILKVHEYEKGDTDSGCNASSGETL